MDLSVVIPAYQEHANLQLLLPRLLGTVAALTPDHEVLVIDTLEPMDQTPALCAELGVTYVNRTGGNSYGDAVRTGLARATGTYVVFMDGDGSHDPEFVAKLYREREPYDVVVASRYVQDGTTENPLVLILMSRTLNMIYSLVLGLPCKDVSNSFKLYRRSLLDGIVLSSQNFDVVEELLFKMNRRHPLRIKEIPFRFRKRLHGKTKRNLLLFMLTYLVSLLRLRFGR